MATPLQVVILAAGAGTRMKSSLPKVLHPLLGKPMLQHVIDASKALSPRDIFIVYGHHGEHVKSVIANESLHWVMQEKQLGTGHALQTVLPALEKCAKDSKVLILNGDVPAITPDTLHQMVVLAHQYPIVLLNAIFEDSTGFGRIVRDTKNNILGIIEHKDATESQRQIKEIYSGMMLVDLHVLEKFLPQLTNDNAQKEFYLTQLIDLAHQADVKIGSVITNDCHEVFNVNDREQLVLLEKHLQQKLAKYHLKNGVTVIDPARFDVRGELIIAADVTVDINCIFEGKVTIDSGTRIGAHCILKNCSLGKNVTIHPYTFIDGAIIADSAIVGPYARIRPETEIGESAHVGNFVEVKKTKLGKRSKANHLSYLGDAIIGDNVNVGAGTITCNYDGINKHQTIIEDGAFIGSDTQLVAPVRVGKNATIGAGSTITKDTPDEHLTLSRSKQLTIESWNRPKKK